MKLKKILLLICIILLLTICFSINVKDTVNKPESNKTAKKTEEIMKSILSPEITEQKLEKLIGYEVNKFDIPIGKDSYIQESLSQDKIDKNELGNYKIKQNNLAEEVENLNLKNIDYNIINTEILNHEVIHTMEIVGFYYELYCADLTELQFKIFESAGYDSNSIENNPKSEVAFYKSKIKAMEIMGNYLQNYENYSEKIEIKVIYSDGKLKNEDQITTLLAGVRGMMYDNMNFSKIKNRNDQLNRIDLYYTKAIEKGVLNLNDPLQLNLG